MITWIIKYKKEDYAIIAFDKKLKVIKLTPRAENHGLYDVFGQEVLAWNIRKIGFSRLTVDNIKDKYDADLYVTHFFASDNFTVECDTKIDWAQFYNTTPGIHQ